MQIAIHNRDILAVTEADTIVLPVDGSGPGLTGNTTRRFMKHVGVSSEHELMAPPPHYPFAGEPLWCEIRGLFDTHFEWACFIDSLSHAGAADHRANLRKTLNLMFHGMSSGGVGKSVACTILTGGSRIPPVDAIYIMLEAAEKWRHLPYDVHIAETDPERFALLYQLAR